MEFALMTRDCLNLCVLLALTPTLALDAVAADRAPTWSAEVSEQAPAGALVADLRDLSGIDSSDWQLSGSESDSPFALDPETGRLRLKDYGAVDHERRSQYLLTLRAALPSGRDPAAELFAEDLRRSGELGYAAAEVAEQRTVRLRLQVLDEPEPPQLAEQPQTLRFDAHNPWLEHGVRAVDPDAHDPLQFEILSGNEEGLLVCDRETGRLSLAHNGLELADGHLRVLALIIRVTDTHGLSDQRLISARVAAASNWEGLRVFAAAESEPADLLAERPIHVRLASEPDEVGVVLAAEGDAETMESPTVVNASTPPPAVAAASAPPVDVESADDAGATATLRPTTELMIDSSSVQLAADQVRAIPTGLLRSAGSGPRLNGIADSSSTLLQVTTSWMLTGLVLCAIAAAVKIALRRRSPHSTAHPEESHEAIEVEVDLTSSSALPRAGQRGNSNNRSLRKEMADLLKVSQHFTIQQKAQQQQRFHGRQFWLAAVALAAAGGIAVAQGLLGLDHDFDPGNWIVLACLTLIAAAALRAFMRVRNASEELRKPGPLTGEFRLD